MKRALVLGLARSGLAAKAALEANGSEVVAADRTLGNDTDLGLLEGVDVLVKSPGVPGEAPLVVAARERGIPVWSEIELASRYLAQPDRRHHRHEREDDDDRAARRDAAARTAGNVGTALSELVGEVEPDEWIVCELSSFQLEDIEAFQPRIAVLLNLEPDHLDRHGSFERYRDAKLRIFENQTAEDVAVVPRGFGPVPGAGRRVEFAADDELPAEPLIPGAHNRENAAAATAAARAVGLAEEMIAEALPHFPGRPAPPRARRRARRRPLRQRLEGDEHRGRASSARPPSTLPLHLILGGSLKGERFDEFAQRRRAGECRHRLSDRRGGRAARRRPRLRERALPRLDDARACGRGGGERGSAGGDRAALAGVRELRPVQGLRAPRRGVQEARREPPRVKSPVEASSSSVCSSS